MDTVPGNDRQLLYEISKSLKINFNAEIAGSTFQTTDTTTLEMMSLICVFLPESDFAMLLSRERSSQMNYISVMYFWIFNVRVQLITWQYMRFPQTDVPPPQLVCILQRQLTKCASIIKNVKP